MELNNEHIFGIILAAVTAFFLLCMLLRVLKSFYGTIQSVFYSLPVSRNMLSRNIQEQPSVVVTDSSFHISPPSYDIALLVSRPSTPELHRSTGSNLTQCMTAYNEQRPPSYEAAISISSAESSRRSSSTAELGPEISRSYSLLNYEDAMRNSKTATAASLLR